MEILNADSLARIRAVIATHARPLDQALLAWSDDASYIDAVIAALATYQNPDGGYAHGIEPDMWTPDSGPLSTTIGLQYAMRIGLPLEHPAVQHAMAYLAGKVDIHGLRWQATAAAVDDAPHAPWWHRGPSGVSAIDALTENPTVEILGYFQHYQTSINPFLLDAIAEQAAIRLAAQPNQMEEHVLACYVRWYRLAPPEWQARLLPDLRRIIAGTISTDPTIWSTTYVPTPFLVVESPSDPWYDLLAPAVQAQCAQLVDVLARDGCVQPTWQWGQYLEQWQIARAHWTGKLTVEALLSLRRFGIVE